MMHLMRTTLTIDDDIIAQLRDRARKQRVSFRAMVGVALRTGLGALHRPKRPRHARVPTFSIGFKKEFDLRKALALADTIENDEIARKLRLRK